MTTLPLNGVRLRVRLVEVEVSRLKLDPENPRLHSAYLTHDLPARPNVKQIAAVLEQLPEFQALLDAITRNDGVFQPPLVTADFRILEGNRRVAALRRLQAADAKNTQWRTVTVYAARSIRSVRPNSMGGLSESEIGNNEAKNTIKLTTIMTAGKYKTRAVRRHSGARRKPCESSKAAAGRAIKDTRAAFS